MVASCKGHVSQYVSPYAVKYSWLTDLQALLKTVELFYNGRTWASATKQWLNMNTEARHWPALCPGCPSTWHPFYRKLDDFPLGILIKIPRKGKVPFPLSWERKVSMTIHHWISPWVKKQQGLGSVDLVTIAGYTSSPESFSLMRSNKILDGYAGQNQSKIKASGTKVSGKSLQGPTDASSEDIQIEESTMNKKLKHYSCIL